MKYTAAVFVVASLTAGLAMAETITTVECDNAMVSINEEQTMKIKEVTGEENFGTDVCAVIAEVDASKYTDPTDVDITLANGSVYQVSLQAR